MRSALIAEPDLEETVTAGNAEDREVAGLHRRASIVSYFEELHREQEADGAERELRTPLLGENAVPGRMPVEMLLPPGLLLETRNDAATTVADAAVVAGSQAGILPRVFTNSIANRLLVSMPSVPVGQASFPVMLTGTSADMKAPGVSQSAGAATFTGFTLEPKRLTGRYVWRIEDAAKLRNYEAALRLDLSAVMSDSMDNQIVNGTGADDQVTGFFTELAAATVDDTATTWAEYLGKFTGLVDGINAYNLSDVRAVIGADTFSYTEGLFASVSDGTRPRRSASDYVGSRIGGISVSSRIPAKDGTANTQSNIVALTSYPGRNAVAPMWNYLDFIRDHYSKAAAGEVALTAHMLFNFKIVRETGFNLISVKTA